MQVLLPLALRMGIAEEYLAKGVLWVNKLR